VTMCVLKQSLFCKRKSEKICAFAKKTHKIIKKIHDAGCSSCQHALFLLDNGREATVTVHGHRKVANGEGHTSVFVFRAPVRTLGRS
jgi:hypothetical protein